MMSIACMCIAAFALIIAASNVIYAIVRCSDPSIAERQESGLLPTRADIAAEKRRRCKVPVAFAIVFLIVAVIAFVFYGFTRNTSSSDDPTSGATGGQAAIVEKDDSEPENGASGDAGKTEPTAEPTTAPATENGAAEAETLANTESFVSAAMNAVSASLNGLNADIATPTPTPEATASSNGSAEEEPKAENITTAEELRDKGYAEASKGWSWLNAMVVPDETFVPVNTIIKIDANWAYRRFGQYRMDTMLHLDWADADWMMEYLSTKSYNGQISDDILALPAFVDYDWIEQAMGTRRVTAEDLMSIDLNDHEAIKKLVDGHWTEWQKEYNALTLEEKMAKVDETVCFLIVNMEGYAEAWYLAFKECDGIYMAAKDVLDGMDRYFIDDYNLEGKNPKTEAVGRECHLVYPENADYFNPDRPEFSATFSDDYFENVTAQLCNIYMELHSNGFKTIKTDTHWCLPRLTESALRHAVPANYADKYEALIKILYGKGGELAYKLGVNVTDMRPMIFPVTAYERQNPPSKTETKYPFVIYYVYENNGGTAAPTYGPEQLKAGTWRQVTSPTIAGYTPDIKVVEGTMPAAPWTVIVTYRKDTPPPNNDEPNPGPGPGPTPGPTPGPNDGEGAKDDSADPVNQGNADAGGGEQEAGLDKEQDIAQEVEDAENYTPPASTPTPSPSPSPNPSPAPTGTPDGNGNTIFEGDLSSQPDGGEKSGTVTSTTVTDNGNGTTTTVETETDTDSERNEASQESFSGF